MVTSAARCRSRAVRAGEGQVRARAAVVAGELIGALTVEDRLEVGAAAVIKGRVTARTLAIARGAVHRR